MMVMDHMVDQLMEDPVPKDPPQVSQHAYEQWARGFVFDGLRDQRYGQSFCNHFNIRDNILYYATTVEEADAYIQKVYIK